MQMIIWQITQIWYNDLIETEQNSDEYQKTKGCFYKGIVQGQVNSRVTVSLCGGMVNFQYNSCNANNCLGFCLKKNISEWTHLHIEFIIFNLSCGKVYIEPY